GRGAAARDDVVDTGVRGDVLPHHVDHEVERLDAVERRTPALGRTRRVGRNTVEAELGRGVGERPLGPGVVLVGGMPTQHGVDAVEQPRAYHVDLAAAALLSRGAV